MAQSISEFRASLQKRELENQIKSCQERIQFHFKKEQEYRDADNWHMIHYCKQRRKQLQSDMVYYQRELQKLAA